MARFYTDLGYLPWAVYTTFSDGVNGLHSYRVMWRVEVDHNVTYEQWAEVIKSLSGLTEYGDKRARDCSRVCGKVRMLVLAGTCLGFSGPTQNLRPN